MQAEQAASLRNEFRTAARELMADREKAADLYQNKPNLTWEQVKQKYENRGYSGDALYQQIIESSQRTNPDVNKSFGLGGGNK